MKTVNKVNQFLEEREITQEEVNAVATVVGIVVGGAVGLVARKHMYDAGMIKSFWFPCMIKKAGTYRRQSDAK